MIYTYTCATIRQDEPPLPGFEVLVTIALLLAGMIWLCRPCKGDADRTRLLCAVSMGLGIVLLNLPAIHPLIHSVGGPLIMLARLTGWTLGPFVLFAVVAILLLSVPLIAELAEVAQDASSKGLRAGFEAALDRLALIPEGGGARVEAP